MSVNCWGGGVRSVLCVGRSVWTRAETSSVWEVRSLSQGRLHAFKRVQFISGGAPASVAYRCCKNLSPRIQAGYGQPAATHCPLSFLPSVLEHSVSRSPIVCCMAQLAQRTADIEQPFRTRFVTPCSGLLLFLPCCMTCMPNSRSMSSPWQLPRVSTHSAPFFILFLTSHL